jgi:hypothetical protein
MQAYLPERPRVVGAKAIRLKPKRQMLAITLLLSVVRICRGSSEGLLLAMKKNSHSGEIKLSLYMV